MKKWLQGLVFLDTPISYIVIKFGGLVYRGKTHEKVSQSRARKSSLKKPFFEEITIKMD